MWPLWSDPLNVFWLLVWQQQCAMDLFRIVFTKRFKEITHTIVTKTRAEAGSFTKKEAFYRLVPEP